MQKLPQDKLSTDFYASAFYDLSITGFTKLFE